MKAALNSKIVNAQNVSDGRIGKWDDSTQKEMDKKERGTKCFMYDASRKPSWKSY